MNDKFYEIFFSNNPQYKRNDGETKPYNYEIIDKLLEKEGTEKTNIITALEESSWKHRKYNLYLSISIMEKISSSYLLKCGRIDRVNDLLETEASEEGLYYRTYVCCFSHGDESVAMWSVYSTENNEDAKIEFSNAVIKRIYDDLKNELHLYDDKQNLLDCVIEDVKFVDVFYTKKCCADDSPKLKSGFLKNSAWSYEKESRFIITLKENQTLPDAVYIKLNDSELKECSVRISPLCKNYVGKENTGYKNILNSSLSGKIKLNHGRK